MHQDLSLRPARAGDEEAIGELLRQGRPPHLDNVTVEQGSTAESRFSDRARRYIRAGLEEPDAALVLVIEDKDARILAWSRARLFSDPATVLGDQAPPGWYLLGTNVDINHRRLGLGSWLLRHRLQWLEERTDHVYYFTSGDNVASIALHEPFGFKEVRNDLQVPNAGGPKEGFTLFRTALG